MPYNSNSTNIDTTIANACYLGKIIYPEAFTEINPAQKADEIYPALLGQALYAKMAENFRGFRNLKFGD